MKPTLDTVAGLAGVSAATVSRVLNGSGNVAAATRERVVAAARECNYGSNWHVGSRPTVAVISSALDFSYYYGEILPLLDRELSQSGFNCEILPARCLDDLLNTRPICGAVSLMSRDGLQAEWRNLHNIPLVCVNTSPRRVDDIYAVNSDLRQGMRLALEHLLELGHRNICLLLDSLPGSPAWSDLERMEGFSEAVREHKNDARTSIRFNSGRDNVMRSMAMELERGVTAFIYPAYGSSLASYQALALLGCRIPDDVSLILREEADRKSVV